MATDKTQANMGFEKQIWEAACVLWGHIPAADYRKVIVGLIFEEKMTRLATELSNLFAKSHVPEDEIRKKLGAIGYQI